MLTSQGTLLDARHFTRSCKEDNIPIAGEDPRSREEPGSRAVAWIGSCGWHFFGIDKHVLDVANSDHQDYYIFSRGSL